MNNKITHERATEEELLFIRRHMPRGMVAMVCYRTKATRSKVLYQLIQMPRRQNPRIIKATREIFYAVTGLKYR